MNRSFERRLILEQLEPRLCFHFSLRAPEITTEIAPAAIVESDSFALEHALLFVSGQNDSAGRAPALRVDDAMPGNARIGSVHDESNGPRSITLTENRRDLTVSHHASGRNATDYLEYSLAIFGIAHRESKGELPVLVGSLGKGSRFRGPSHVPIRADKLNG
jgi:hypothetical protein